MIIYKITNLINGKIYIGQDSKNRTIEEYSGSGIIIKNSINKYGLKNFIKEVLEVVPDGIEAFDRESYWVEKLDARNKKVGYNIAYPGPNFRLGCKNSIEHRKKISESNKISQKGKILSNEHREKISKSHIGILHTPETIEKLRILNIGRKHKLETKEKIRIGNTGISRPQTDEHRANISKSKSGENHPWYGKNLPDEHRTNISKAKKGISNYNVLKKYIIETPNNIVEIIGRKNVIEILNCSSKIFKSPYKSYKGYKLLNVLKLTEEEISVLKINK